MRRVRFISMAGLVFTMGLAYVWASEARASWAAASPLLTLFAVSLSVFIATVADETGGDPV